MSATMFISAALAASGIALSGIAYMFAPSTSRFSIWDVGLVGGISTTALGTLGALTEVVTAL